MKKEQHHSALVLKALKKSQKALYSNCFKWWRIGDFSCSLTFNGNSAFCFQRRCRFQTKTLQPQLTRARTNSILKNISVDIKNRLIFCEIKIAN